MSVSVCVCVCVCVCVHVCFHHGARTFYELLIGNRMYGTKRETRENINKRKEKNEWRRMESE